MFQAEPVAGVSSLPVGIVNNKRRMYRIQRLIRDFISGF